MGREGVAASGKPLWNKRFGRGSFDSGVDVAVDQADDSVVLTGDFLDTVDFGGGDLTSAGSSDIFLAKFDAAGNHLSSHGFGDSAIQAARRIALDESGGVFWTGLTQGTLNLGGDDLVGQDTHSVLFAARFDGSGQHLWSTLVMAAHFGTAADHAAGEDSFSMAPDPHGNLHVMVSYSDGSVAGSRDEAPSAPHLLVAHFGPDGAVLGHQHYGVDPSKQIDGGMAVNAAGNLEIAGGLEGTVNFGGSWLTSVGTRDLFMAELGTDGAHIRSFGFGEHATSIVSRSLTIDPWGDEIVCGNSSTVGGMATMFLAMFPR